MARPRRGARRPRRRVWLVSPDGFRELRHACLLNRKACAAFLGVCERTVRHWDAGRNRVPWSAVRLLRLLRCGDLGALHDGWAGWTLTPRGELVSGNGYVFQPWRLAAWPIVCEQARFWLQDRARSAAGGVGAPAPASAGARPEAGRTLPDAEAVHPAAPAAPVGTPAPFPAEPAFKGAPGSMTVAHAAGFGLHAAACAAVERGLDFEASEKREASSRLTSRQPSRETALSPGAIHTAPKPVVARTSCCAGSDRSPAMLVRL